MTQRIPTSPPQPLYEAATLDALIAEATADCHDTSEQTYGMYAMLLDHLEMPFATEILGMEAVVEDVTMDDAERLMAVCSRGSHRMVLPLQDLHLPSPPPRGAEWIAAFRRWHG